MPRNYKPEESVAKLRQVDVLVSQDQNIADAIRQIDGLQAKRLKELETENIRLRKEVSDLALDKLILQEAARGK
jgi:putative transposase